MHVSNPFTASKRREQRDEAIMDTHRKERQQREDTRQAAWESSQRAQQMQKGVDRAGGPGGNKGASLAERSKYQFEADSEDDEMENEIDANLDALHGAAGRLKGLASAMGTEVDQQNKHIARITDKVSWLSDSSNWLAFCGGFADTSRNPDRPRRRPDCHEPRPPRPHQIRVERDKTIDQSGICGAPFRRSATLALYIHTFPPNERKRKRRRDERMRVATHPKKWRIHLSLSPHLKAHGVFFGTIILFLCNGMTLLNPRCMQTVLWAFFLLYISRCTCFFRREMKFLGW